MPNPRTPEQVRQQIKRIRTARWVLVTISAALAIALIVSGNVLIGAFVGVMAGVRAWMLVTMPRGRGWRRPPGRIDFGERDS